MEKVTGFYAPGNHIDLRPRKPLVIAFGHKARNGKDSACNYLMEAWGGQYEIKKYSFADALKREVTMLGDLRTFCTAFGVPYDENPPLDDPLCPPPHGKQRRLLQVWGTEFRRRSHPDYWVRQTRIQIEKDAPAIALIADLRFKNEFSMVKSMGGLTVQVERPGFVSGAEGHVSETELDGAPYDYTIRSENLTALKGNLHWILSQIGRDFLEPSSNLSCVE